MKKRLIGALVLVGILGLYWSLERRGYLMPVAALPSVLCVGGCPASGPVHKRPAASLNPNRPLAKLLDLDTINRAQVSLLLEKHRHRLTVFYRSQPIKSYPIVLGTAPIGDKRREGDRKTPEGLFRLRDQYPHANWSKFLWLNYPNPASWRKHWQAKLTGEINWTDTIGSEVGIHGVPAGADHWITDQKNWTWGCPSLRNQDIDELYRVTQVGTVVEILP